MSSSLKIPLLIAGATSTVGIGVFSINGFRSTKENTRTISSFLSENPTKRAISIGEDSDWNKAWTAYKGSGKDIWKLGSGSSVPVEFKNTCKKEFESKVSGTDSEGYKNFISYCTRDTLIFDLLKDSGEVPLSKTEEATSEGWKKAWESYIEANQNKPDGQDDWKINNFKSEKSNKDKALDAFRDVCESNLGSKEIFKDILLDQVKKWCTKPKGVG
ncbi:hypothetical protein MHC_04675 [Mycoplasma haemocanis str. Illinois]|uniref:Uncharacterized protein n=1 Tax=Mycoplasma haemocanis (strain Illinois) TaxID=1111676 RepID=H6N819_MYCHN|nr:hypothetical protein [Mycoplasma haemocanis]AEW45791.1 hypothetical protein MHC_04675 [Mycoplasma haemocanis str. Illinois]